MRKFIRKTTLFVSIPFVCFILLFSILKFVNYKIVKSHRLDSSVNTVFLGDSHIEQAINDSLLEHSVNLAKSSESFYFSYYKLKNLLEQNPSIREVYLGFSYHSLSSYYDKFIFGEFSNAVSSRYFPMLPYEEQLKMFNANRNDIFSFIKAIVKNDVLNIIRQKKTYLGGYENVFTDTKVSKESIEKRILFQYYNEGSVNEYSKINMEYLYKIKVLCRQSKVNLYLLNTPIHSLNSTRIPEKFKIKLEQVIDSLDLKVIDLSGLFSEDYYFIPDGDHVSQQGATATTKYLASIMK